MNNHIYAIIMRDCDSAPEIARMEYAVLPDNVLRIKTEDAHLDLLTKEYHTNEEREKKSIKLEQLKHVNSSSYFAIANRSEIFINPSYFNQENTRKKLPGLLKEWRAEIHSEKIFPCRIKNTLEKQSLDDFFKEEQ